MTLEEYLNSTNSEIKNASTRTEVNDILAKAKQTLINSDIPKTEIRLFWTELYDKAQRGRIIKEQNHDSTHELVAYAQSLIAEYSQQSSK